MGVSKDRSAERIIPRPQIVMTADFMKMPHICFELIDLLDQ